MKCKYLLLLNGKNVDAKAPQCYVILTLPVFFSDPLTPDISSIRPRLRNFSRLSLGFFWITDKSHMMLSADLKYIGVYLRRRKTNKHVTLARRAQLREVG